MRATPLVRRQGTNTLFRHKVDNRKFEMESNPRDSRMKRCIICKIPNEISRRKCRFCLAENWDQRFDAKLR